MGTTIRQALGRFWAAIVLALALLTPASSAISGDAHLHEGVASCGGSTCHGRLAPSGHVVRQNELITWQNESSAAGAHSRAWRVLTEPRGEAIAARLGLGPAENAPSCLGCHSGNIPAALRGPGFQLSDGVGCESCHGGSSGWLASHYAVGATHAQNVAHGMVALDDARTRASMCVSCHFGGNSPGYELTHKIMAAGHPRVSFELDLFSALQSHYDFDADYAARKQIPGGVKLWAVGQAMALERVLALYREPARNGMFPDFYFYDCQSCHRPLTSTRDPQLTAMTNPDRHIPPGTPPFDDENMIMLGAAVDIAAPQLADRFRSGMQAFHSGLAANREQAVIAASRLIDIASDLSDAFAAHTFTRADTFAILDRLASGAATARYTDYAGGAQAVMAIDTLLTALVTARQVDRNAAKAIRPNIDALYRDVHDPNAYRPSEFRNALANVAASVRRLR